MTLSFTAPAGNHRQDDFNVLHIDIDPTESWTTHLYSWRIGFLFRQQCNVRLIVSEVEVNHLLAQTLYGDRGQYGSGNQGPREFSWGMDRPVL